jgi:hypothetical protein
MMRERDTGRYQAGYIGGFAKAAGQSPFAHAKSRATLKAAALSCNEAANWGAYHQCSKGDL